MKAVARLVLSYFTCTPALRVFSSAGLVALVISFYATRAPDLALTVGMLGVGMSALAMAGIASIYVGSGLMPLMFGRLARSHLIGVLPWGRLKLLVSAFITVALVSAPAPIYMYLTSTVHDGGKPLDPALAAKMYAGLMNLVWVLYTSSILLTSWLYLALWFVTSQRTIAGYLKGLLVIVIVIFAPTRDIQTLSGTLQWNLIQGAVLWSVFGAGFLLWPRLRAFVARLRSRSDAAVGALVKPRIAGREIDLLLGTGNPWFLVTAQAVPILLATKIGFYSAAVWLFYLTTFSTVSGAIAGQAAERSRALWLRGSWSRAELFSLVERSFWRHNSYALGVLLVLMVAIGSYTQLPTSLLAAGLPLLVLGTVMSTYLGLMITRGLHWLEAVLAISVMLTLMAVAVLAARSTDNLAIITVLEVALACLAFVFRAAARRRWAQIDWMMCRPDRALTARAAS